MVQIASRYEQIHQFADVVEDAEAIKDDHEFTFASGALRVVHTPGHTPGSCCLLRESNRLLLTGDTILKNITPNPVLNPDRSIRSAGFLRSVNTWFHWLAFVRSRRHCSEPHTATM